MSGIVDDVTPKAVAEAIGKQEGVFGKVLSAWVETGGTKAGAAKAGMTQNEFERRLAQIFRGSIVGREYSRISGKYV